MARDLFNLKLNKEQPEEAIKHLETLGFQEALVLGGSKINSSFMKNGLVDEIYLDVHAHILGQGIPLFAPADFEYKLELLEIKKLSEQTLQLHYKVKE